MSEPSKESLERAALWVGPARQRSLAIAFDAVQRAERDQLKAQRDALLVALKLIIAELQERGTVTNDALFKARAAIHQVAGREV